MRVAIWGDGFIGSHLADVMAAAGHAVVMLRRDAGTKSNVADAFVSKELSFSSPPEDMVSALFGVDVLVHSAGSAANQYDLYHEATLRMGHAVAQAGVKRFVMLSTVGVYGDALPERGLGEPSEIATACEPRPNTPYAQSRLNAERDIRALLESAGIECIIARVPSVVGPRMNASVLRRLFLLVRCRIFPVPGPTSTTFPCVGIRRLSECLAWLATEQTLPKVLFQFSDSVTWLDIVGMFEADIGIRVLRVRMPGGLLLRIFSIIGLSRIETVLCALMNTATYQDDSVLIESALQQQLPTTTECMLACVRSLCRGRS